MAAPAFGVMSRDIVNDAIHRLDHPSYQDVARLALQQMSTVLGRLEAEAVAPLEVLARAFAPPVELSPILEPSVSLADRVLSGDMEGIVLKDREAPYRSGSRRGWAKVKAPDWNERHRERFGRR